ncbi:MAG: hypothetical protein DCC75_06185 [Proteobacteria bacterium]|nr:MAG: hypothetical protein DCC75_06185 [Pseudomonadota bacterium]
MDVKKLQIRPPQTDIPNTDKGKGQPSLKNSGELTEAARIELRPKPQRGSEEARAKLNRVVNIANVAGDATKVIGSFVDAIRGLVEQVDNSENSPERREALEKEANQLIEAIKRTAHESSYDGVKPLAGDTIRLEIEQKIGRVLDVILPDDAKDAFGLTGVVFSRKDAIIETSTSIARARKRIDELGDSIDKLSQQLRDLAKTIDEDFESGPALPDKVRNVEGAVDLAQETKASIANEPKRALSSLGSIERDADLLLK